LILCPAEIDSKWRGKQAFGFLLRIALVSSQTAWTESRFSLITKNAMPKISYWQSNEPSTATPVLAMGVRRSQYGQQASGLKEKQVQFSRT
jgi:hypothetical protein